MKYAMALAGNIVVDTIKYISAYPNKLELTAIKSTKRSLGGAVPNVGIDLARLDPSLSLKAVGFVGDDENGAFALEQLGRYPSIDLSDVRRGGVTSFTDVMTVESTGERTFFTFKGADGLLTAQSMPWDNLNCDILHVGYALLLDGMDEPDSECGTVMARSLREAQSRGIRTSLDVVSEHSNRFERVVRPALKYTDYFSVNEFEAQQITGVPLTEGGRPAGSRMREALELLRAMGVKRRAVIHTPGAAFGLDEDGRYAEAESLRLPAGFIKGSVGAGDAFTAGFLLETWRGQPLETALETANAVAALSLSEPGATEGVLPLDQCLDFARTMKERI